MRRAAWLVAAASFVAAAARASGPGAEDAWDALDRLYPHSHAGPPGLTLRVGAVTRRAVENDLVLRVDAGAEPARGPGVRVAAALDRASGAREAAGALVARGSRFRAETGAALLRWRDEGALALEASLHVVALPGLVAGAETRLWPGEGAWAPETAWSLHVGRANWWGGVSLRSGSHRVRAAVGSAWAGGLSWFAAFEEGNPSAGVSLALGVLELRAAETSHAALGTVSEVSLRLAARPS